MMRRLPIALALAQTLAFAIPCLATAADAGSGEPATAATGEETPVFGTGVSVVTVPVFVVDKHGKAIPGLQPEDFELYDDKKPVPIVSFKYVDTTSEESQREIREAPAARRRFLLLFDLSFTDVAGLHRAREAAQTFLRTRLAESDLAAVATFDTTRGLRLVANFTEDRGLLAHAVHTLGVPQLARIADPLNLSVVTELIDTPFGSGDIDDTTSRVIADQVLTTIAQRMRVLDEGIYRAQVMQLLENFEDLAEALRNVEGRKQVLLFSAGFDSGVLIGQTGEALRQSGEAFVQGRLYDIDPESRYGDMRVRTLFGEMTKTLANADCVVHSIDVTGFGREDSLSQQVVSSDVRRNTHGRESLYYISAETGGRFFKDTNDIGAILGEVLDMTSRYYVLGYQPEDLEGPGTFHKLQVKVARKGAKVSNRGGYYERVPRPQQTPLQRKFEAAQLVMTGLGENDLHFDALALPFPSSAEKQTLGLVLQVPMEDIRGPEGSGSLEVYGYAVAEDGSVVDHVAQLARIDLARADPEGKARGLSVYGSLEVPPGRYTLKLMLQQPETGSAGVQFIDLNVPPYDPFMGFLLPPVLVDDADRWLALHMGAGRSDGPVFPFTVEGEPFLPRTSFEVSPGREERMVLIAFEPDLYGDPAAGIEIQSSVTDAAGEYVPAGLLKLDQLHHDRDGRRTYVLSYTPEQLAAGDYTLRIGIGESGTRLESYALLRVPEVSAQ